MGSQSVANLLIQVCCKEGNNTCADCGSPDVEYASYSLGVTLCQDCAGIHRSLGSHISKVKSLKNDNWDQEQVQTMDSIGNIKSNAKYLQHVPFCYGKLKKTSAQVMREQWIRAKYERLEFQDKDRQVYTRPTKTGYLWKKGRDDQKFQQRLFELNSRENQLCYYIQDKTKIRESKSKSPKACLNVEELNCCFVPDKIGNMNGMQISYDSDGSTRHLYVYAEDGKDIMDWFLAIRHAKLTRLSIGLPHLSQEELLARLTRDFVLEGWLYKTGPHVREGWKRRWFTFDRRTLSYFSEPLSAFAKGEIFVGHESDGFSVSEGIPSGRPDHMYSFTLTVPNRSYCLSADTKEDQERWINTLQKTVSTPLGSQDTNLYLKKWSGRNQSVS